METTGADGVAEADEGGGSVRGHGGEGPTATASLLLSLLPLYPLVAIEQPEGAFKMSMGGIPWRSRG